MTDYIKRSDAIRAMAQYMMDTALIDNPEASDRIEEWEGNIAAPVMSTVEAADVIERDGAGYEWCTDCKEYDKDKHCCPRWNKVIRDTMDEIRQNAEKNWDKVEVVRCKDCKHGLRNAFKRDKDIVICDMHGEYRKIDDYCSDGEMGKYDSD